MRDDDDRVWLRPAPILQSFFTDRLVVQRQASMATIAAYRDTLRLLLNWLAATTGIPPANADLGQRHVTTITGFLGASEVSGVGGGCEERVRALTG